MNVETPKSSDEWDVKWEGIFEKYQSDLRHGYYVGSLIGDSCNSVLEIGAGSFRDIAFLSRHGFEVFGFDYSPVACEKAIARFPELSKNFWCGNAFQIDLESKSVDASFSNGFIGCFDDEKILQLLTEQKRVTKKIMIATVHNAHNLDFQRYFKKRSAEDNLYSIRFFSLDDVERLQRDLQVRFDVYPVGKGYVADEDILIRSDASLVKIRDFILEQGMRKLDSSERLMLVARL